MEHMLKKSLAIAALVGVVAVEAASSTPTLVYRSQGFHADRQKTAGMVGHTDQDEMESWYGTFDMGVGYARSFRDNRIARSLFGADVSCADDCNDATILVQGSEIASRSATAWLADYLYLPCDFSGSFSVSPSIQNVLVDFDLYLGLDEWMSGLFFRAYGPVNWTKWQINFSEGTSSTTTGTCAGGYFVPTAGSETYLTSITSYFQGKVPTTTDSVTFNGLQQAKIDCGCSNTKTGFADLRVVLGWNFLQDDDYHLGLNIQAAAPTGTKREGTYVMQPVVGNGHHWELGGGLGAHYVFWRSEDEEKSFGFYLDANVTHLFKSTENRTFDLTNNGDNSRYMIATQFTSTISDVLTGAATFAATAPASAVAPSKQFAKVYAPVANLTTLDVGVSIGAQADVCAQFNFTARGFSWDLGYDFWGRSCESISCPQSCDPCGSCATLCTTGQANTWALKGDAFMFGYDSVNGGAVPLSATQNNATIHSGVSGTTVSTNGTVNAAATLNPNVDNSNFAYGNSTGTGTQEALLGSAYRGITASATNTVKTSVNPVFINCCNIATKGQETKGLSNTIFTHLSYTWDRDSWTPFLGLGGSAEFGSNPNCPGSGSCGTSSNTTVNTGCNTSCGSSASCGSSTSSCGGCVKTSLSQWTVWVKGGVSFN